MPFTGDNDPFDEIVREFFGKDVGGSPRGRREVVKGESDARQTDFVEDENHAYLVVEVPGYDDKDISVEVTGENLNVNASKKEEDLEGVPEYMSNKLVKGMAISKTLPDNVKAKGFSKTVKNGILEVAFNKK